MMQQAIAVRPEGREKNAPNFDSGASQGSVMASATRILVRIVKKDSNRVAASTKSPSALPTVR